MMAQNRVTMGALKPLITALLLGSILVAPFIVLELLSRRTFHEAFPLLLFTFMSVHALSIGLLLTPPLLRLQANRNLRTLRMGYWVLLLLAVFLGYVYVNVVIDQLPCFLGVPICD